MADKLKKASRAHTRYYTTDGTLVPGSTTITGLLNKPALVKWANNLGLQGIDSSKYVDKAARVGTLIHEGKGWDGTYNGRPAIADTYFYSLLY